MSSVKPVFTGMLSYSFKFRTPKISISSFWKTLGDDHSQPASGKNPYQVQNLCCNLYGFIKKYKFVIDIYFLCCFYCGPLRILSLQMNVSDA